MDVCGPQKRRRGFFLHSEAGEPDAGDHENAEGLPVRTRLTRSPTPRQFSSARRARATNSLSGMEDGRPQIRSGTVTGSRQRAHLPR
jgi:hypothetical protein